MYALVDGNNFYVSCERVFQPRLVGKPVVVLSSNDGACIARSNEAKEMGVKMAQPWFQVRHLEKTRGLIAVSANHELYGDMSARMMAVEARYAPRQEVYSVDESFLDFEGVRDDLVATGRAMRAAILRETGLPTSVGFGATKTLAKLANNIAKMADRQLGGYPAHLAQVCDFGRLPRHELDALFAATDVGMVWGIGKRTTEKLKAGGVATVLDLVRADVTALRRQFSVVVEKTVRELHGTSCMEIDEAPAPRQQILVSRSFGVPITDVDGILEAVSEFASRAAERLRQQGSVAGAIGIFFTTSPFRTNDRQHAVNVTVPLVRPTADTAVLLRAAEMAVRTQFRTGMRYTKAGAVLSELQATGHEQGELDLFSAEAEPDTPAADPRARLMAAMDLLNDRFGRDSVRLGNTAVASRGAEVAVWATKQERRSPRFTHAMERDARGAHLNPRRWHPRAGPPRQWDKLYKPFISIEDRMPRTPSPLHAKRVPKSVSRTTLTAEAAATVAESAVEAPPEPAAKKARRAAAPAPEAVEKPGKAHKPKLVRDSFTIPKDEYQVLELLKRRALGFERHVRKSELLRAGIQALDAMSDRAFLKAIGAVPTLKTGRPKAD